MRKTLSNGEESEEQSLLVWLEPKYLCSVDNVWMAMAHMAHVVDTIKIFVPFLVKQVRPLPLTNRGAKVRMGKINLVVESRLSRLVFGYLDNMQGFCRVR